MKDLRELLVGHEGWGDTVIDEPSHGRRKD